MQHKQKGFNLLVEPFFNNVRISKILAFTFSVEGIIVSSRTEFNGIAGIFSEPMTITGASNYLKHSS